MSSGDHFSTFSNTKTLQILSFFCPFLMPCHFILNSAEPLGFQNLHKVISHNTSDNKHWELPNKHQIFNINGQGER